MSGAVALAGPPARPHRGTRVPLLDRAAATDVCLGVALVLLWTLEHSFVGIKGDAAIYMGRALADLDPAGVGRDEMFALDGQSSFSLFRIVARTLAAALGLGPTVAILSLANMVAWFAAAAVFVRTVAPGRAGVLLLAAVCVLPRLYTPWNLLAAGESIPVPRPLAEAGVLVAMAALCQGRFLLCAVLLAVAAAFHPIMAAPGFGVLLVELGRRDRRWFGVAALVGLGLVGAGACGAPLASRLAVAVDPAWLAILRDRNPYLFVHLWPAGSLGLVTVQAVTVVIAGTWLAPPARRVFGAALAVALLGCAAAWLAGDLLANLLVLQAQLWRSIWLPAVLATFAAGLCLWHLPRHGAVGQITLACLCLAWVGFDTLPLAPCAALAGALVWFGAPRFSFAPGRGAVAAAWIACGLLAASCEWSAVAAFRMLLAKMPDDVHSTWSMATALRLEIVPAMVLAFAMARWPVVGAVRLLLGLFVALGLAMTLTLWDLETPARADADAARIKPDLVALLATRPGEVLWLGSDDVWYWARRPNWNGQTQGGGIVFSRDLAVKWRGRSQAMLDAGLATRWLLDPWGVLPDLRAVALNASKIAAFCAKPDSPAWIVSPLEPGMMPPPELAAAIWTPPLAQISFVVGVQDVRWWSLDRYAVVPCGSSPAK